VSEEVALVLIDYQKEMFENVKSETTPDEIDLNVRLLIRAVKAFRISVVLSTVVVKMGVNGPTRASIAGELPGIEFIDPSAMNARENTTFRTTIEKRAEKG
jgi:nicotinamidase-related amidase